MAPKGKPPGPRPKMNPKTGTGSPPKQPVLPTPGAPTQNPGK